MPPVETWHARLTTPPCLISPCAKSWVGLHGQEKKTNIHQFPLPIPPSYFEVCNFTPPLLFVLVPHLHSFIHFSWSCPPPFSLFAELSRYQCSVLLMHSSLKCPVLGELIPPPPPEAFFLKHPVLMRNILKATQSG